MSKRPGEVLFIVHSQNSADDSSKRQKPDERRAEINNELEELQKKRVQQGVPTVPQNESAADFEKREQMVGQLFWLTLPIFCFAGLISSSMCSKQS